jgi:hypothetical protein
MNAFGGILGFTLVANSFNVSGEYVLTPPTVAPVLIVSAGFGSTTANLEWTASNKTSSAGFGYRIYRQKNGLGYDVLTTTTSLIYDDTPSPEPAGEYYEYYIEPYNDAGPATGGGLSNESEIVLPGELDGPILLGPNGTQNSQYVYDDFILTWSDLPVAAHYNVYGSAVDSGYTLWQGNVEDLSLAISFASAFGTNWWYVVGIDSDGNSSYASNHLECTPVASSATLRRSEDGTLRNLENGTPRTLQG